MPGFDDLVDFFDTMQSDSPVGELHRALFAVSEVRAGMKVVDVGGGPSLLGRTAARAGAKVAVVDLSWRMLGRARTRAEEAAVLLAPVRGDADSLPFGPGALDRVFCTNLMFLRKDSIELLRELARVLRPGGKLLMLNPTRRMNPVTMRARSRAMDWHGFALEFAQAWSRAAEANHPYSRERLSRELRAAGMVIEMMAEEWDGMALLAKARRPEE